ncbi:MAG TPA: hypothetical protein VIM70_04835 [Clostridium sp.]|uniref:alpha/beta hydrolase n=1 Tax=Clostridium sp. TaxID=1506 RepID=UPI002F92DD92
MKSPFLFTVHLPSNLVKEKKYPVIYAMHGMGSNEKNILNLIEELQNDFILIGIRGPILKDNGFAYFNIKSYGNPDIDSFDSVVANLKEFINNAPKSYPIDTTNQYLLGFSQGAILSMTLALIMGDKLKGIIALSGYIPKHVKVKHVTKPLSNLLVFISHGEFDPIFPVSVGKDNYDFFKARDEKVTYKLYPVGHEVSLDIKNDFVKWLYSHR